MIGMSKIIISKNTYKEINFIIKMKQTQIIYYLPSFLFFRYGLIKFKPYIFFPNIKIQEQKLTNIYFNEDYIIL